MTTQSLRAACCCASVFALALASGASAQDLSPDEHAPAGVMFDHTHDAGHWMLGYRFSLEQSGSAMRHGGETATDIAVSGACGAHPCSMTASDMTMEMHMLHVMYAPTDRFTLMLMPMWMSHEMDMRELDLPEAEEPEEHGGHGGHAGAHSHGTEGWGDTVFGALVRLADAEDLHAHLGLMVSAPTGSVDHKNPDGTFVHYAMQSGSGTWDFLPSVTVGGELGRLSWGAQLLGVVRLEEKNDSGYSLGEGSEATAWTAFQMNDWLSASVRLKRLEQGAIEGHYNGPHNHSAPVDLQPNYGGIFHDAGLGLNLVVPRGPLAGHRFSAEWLKPLGDDVNGYQLERSGVLHLAWSKAF